MATPLFALPIALLLIFAYWNITSGPDDPDHPLWPRNKTRDMSVYVKPNKITFLHEPKNICTDLNTTKKLELLIVVNSATTHFQHRQYIRDTWGEPTQYSFLESNSVVPSINETEYFNVTSLDSEEEKQKRTDRKFVDLMFVMGLPLNQSDQNMIDEEAEKYGDILQEDFIDTYHNSSIKSTYMLKWVSSKCGGKVNRVLKTDDDIDVSIYGILMNDVVEKRRNPHYKNDEKYFLSGNSKCGLIPMRNVSSKWYTPYYMFPRRTFPCFLYGQGYQFTVPVASVLYNAALKTPLIPLEDVYITGLCVENSTPRLKPINNIKYEIYMKPALTMFNDTDLSMTQYDILSQRTDVDNINEVKI